MSQPSPARGSSGDVAAAATEPAEGGAVASAALFGRRREIVILHGGQTYRPGLNVRPLPGTTLRLGIQLPLPRARTSDYTIHGGLVREF